MRDFGQARTRGSPGIATCGLWRGPRIGHSIQVKQPNQVGENTPAGLPQLQVCYGGERLGRQKPERVGQGGYQPHHTGRLVYTHALNLGFQCLPKVI